MGDLSVKSTSTSGGGERAGILELKALTFTAGLGIALLVR